MNLRFEKVWFAYENLSGIPTNSSTSQLQDISFEVRPGELVGIVGRSGSGKTTLMQLFNGLLLPDRGRILVDAQDINSSQYDFVALRRRLGVVFQFPETQFFAATVEEEIAFGPQQQKLADDEIALRVAEMLQMVGLDEAIRNRNPFTLSQGEKRRVALASVLAMRPEMLVLDEPTASLDARGMNEVRRILQKWHAAKKMLVIISHDIDLIASLSTRVLVLERGRLLFDGETKSLWESAPPHEVLRQAGLPLPRTERLRRRLPATFHF
jgi:energy-coupling factor transport system ATP-binding protein